MQLETPDLARIAMKSIEADPELRPQQVANPLLCSYVLTLLLGQARFVRAR